jgi:inner membrane protein
MDILIHTTSGMLMGSTIAACNPWQLKSSHRFWLGALLLGGLSGAFPDLDAISQWSRFDATIGHWFSLASGDEIYSGRFWYSHHAFTHSLLASFLFATMIWTITFFTHRTSPVRREKSRHFGLIALLGWNAHLAGDLPTPQGSWDGIAYWWPSQEYIGGTGHTFWWNNYDIFLLIVLALIAHTLLHFIKIKRQAWASSFITSLTILLIIVQLNDRPMNFNDRTLPYQDRERISLAYQQEQLGDRLYYWMVKFDSWLPVYF